MKRGIECSLDWDSTGTLRYTITKKRGRLSLDEIVEALHEQADWDYYLLVVDAFHDPAERIPEEGDCVQLYNADQLKEREVRVANAWE